MPYFSQTDLENALSIPIVKAVYDDDRDGTADSGPIAACLAYGSALCDSFLRKVGIAPGGGVLTLPLTAVPDEVKFAALDFGIAYTIRRRPDIVKASGEQPWTVFYEQAVEQMKRYCASQQMVSPTAMTHATSGGSLFAGATGASGSDLSGSRWLDMGDFG
jgi:hypothetical protein